MNSDINGSVEELREDIPLRKNNTRRSQLWNWLFCRKTECFTGLGLVYTSFATLSISVTFILMMQIYYGAHQLAPHGNVVTDYGECSMIGTTMMKKGGNAVDAAVAAAICLAVVNPHTTGLAAGGVFMTYNHRYRTLPEIIDFGPSAKLDTTVLPRLITGLAFAHDQYGKLPWHALLQPSIDLARNGFLVPKTLSTAIELSKAYELYGTPLPGQKLQLLPLASSLELYSNITLDQFRSLITPENGPVQRIAVNTTFAGYNVYVPGPPTIGPTLLAVLDNMIKYNISAEDLQKLDYSYRLAEIILETYSDLNVSKRSYEVTASVVTASDMEDTYVSIVTGLNGMLGTNHMNPAGYINDNSPALSSDLEISFMPVILTNSKYVCGKRITFGTGDVSLAAQIISDLLIGGKNITEAIESPRFRILGEKEIGIEETFQPNFSDTVIGHLQSIGNLTSLAEPYDGINAIEIFHDHADLHSDSRTGGMPNQF